MIDTETIKFISFLNGLAKKSENGIYPFSVATNEQRCCLFYDDKKTIGEGNLHPLVADYLINDEHHDIISTFTDMYAAKGISIGVEVYDDDTPSVIITSECDSGFGVSVGDGIWYTTEGAIGLSDM